MADDNTARKLDDSSSVERGALRVEVAPWPSAVYDDFMRETSAPEFEGIFEIPEDKRHLLDKK
jgi:hypothetical protein